MKTTEAEHQQHWPTYDDAAPPDHERAASYIAIDDFVDPDEDENVRRCYRALAAEKKALEERALALRESLIWVMQSPTLSSGAVRRIQQALAADDAKAAGEPECATCERQYAELGIKAADVAVPCPHPEPDNRASRRLAYVRKHAARFLRAYIRAGCSADLSRANAIEQAGLIFDETEQSDG